MALPLLPDDKLLLPSQYGEVWRTRVPGARLEILPECGHLPHVEKADVVADKILGLVDASVGASAPGGAR